MFPVAFFSGNDYFGSWGNKPFDQVRVRIMSQFFLTQEMES